MSGVTGPVSGERWSPYPVQDWNTLPYDPLADAPASGPVGGSPVDPSWGPPRPWRRELVPLLVSVLVLVLLVPGLFLGNRLGRGESAAGSSSAIDAFVPEDGAVTRSVRTVAGIESTTPLITESARLTGGTISSGLDWMLSAYVLEALDLDPSGKSFWRTTTTEAIGVGGPQETRVHRVGASLDLVAESRPGRGYVYRPALVELAADARPGSRWESSGTAGPELTYRSEFRASAGAGDCLEVAGRVSYFTVAGQPGPVRVLEDTWCPGQGLTARIERTGDTTTVERAAPAAAADPIVTTADRRPEWTDPAGWRRKVFGTITADPTFGQGAASGTPTSAPAISHSGLVFRQVSGSDDIVALTPKTVTDWLVVWRMHPGGRILTMTAFGDVLVATTSRRQLVAYSDLGQRLWQLDFGELIFDAPVRAGAAELAVVDLAGDLRVVDLATGRVRWQRSVGADVSHAPAAAAGTVLVSDRSGVTHAYALADGRLRWETELARLGGAVDLGDVIVVVSDQTVEAVGAADGRRRWLRPFTGTYQTLVGFAGSVVLASSNGSVLIDASGTTTRLPQAYTLVTVADNFAVGWGTDRADALDPAGRLVASWKVPSLSARSGARAALAYSQGVIALGFDWTLLTLSDEP